MNLMNSEVIGIAGLLGSGRTELANLIFGIDAPDTGELVIKGRESPVFPLWNR